MYMQNNNLSPGADRPDLCRGGDAPAPGRGPSGSVRRTVGASRESTTRRSVPVFGAQIDANTLFDDFAGDQVSGSTKNQALKWSVLKITPIFPWIIS
jgi:hypothetical protein